MSDTPKVQTTTEPPENTDADTLVIGLFEDEERAGDDVAEPVLELIQSGEAKGKFRHLALTRRDGRRYLVVGLGKRETFSGERARVAAAIVYQRTIDLDTQKLCWTVPKLSGTDIKEVAAFATALVEGTVLCAYRFDQYKSDKDQEQGPPKTLIVSSAEDLAEPVKAAAIVAEAQNRARDLQNTPANALTPTELGARAKALAKELEGLTVTVEGREQLTERGMGAFASVTQGSVQEPALITLRYEGPNASGPLLAYVGKAVTFDSGGLSLKTPTGMKEMKFDMSGGAAVIEAIDAIARLQLPVRILGVIGATENMPGGRATKPGDIVESMQGTTIEVINTDAEGRLVLCDCLAYAIELGAERVVDVATLTGAMIITFGDAYGGLFSNDDSFAQLISASAKTSGEPVWRMPLNERYREQIKGQYADIVNATAEPKGSSATAAEFLHRFVGNTAWAHLDIASVAWNYARPYASKGGSGFGVRLLVEVARRNSVS